MHLETSDDSSFFFHAGLLSILRLVFARTYGLPGGFMGAADEVKGWNLTEFDGADVEGP